MSNWISLRHLQRVSRDKFSSKKKKSDLFVGNLNLLLPSNKTADLFEQAVEVYMNAVSTRGIK